MKHFKVIVLGCGASGAMCALTCKEKSLAIIDNSTKPTKKIMVTGNGRCNLTNVNLSSEFYNVNLVSYFNRFNETKTINFFNALGLEVYNDEEGRVYPISNSAKSVMDVINNVIEKKADLFLEHNILSVNKENNFFIVKTSKGEFSCEKLIVATGGNSLDYLNNLGVSYNKFVPSLVALKCENLKDLNGVKASNVKVTIINSLGEQKSEVGEILFKDAGISGIVIFNLSSIFARSNSFKGQIQIDLLPNFSLDVLVEKIKNRKQLNVNLDKIFVGFFVNALANEIFKQAKINTNKNSLKLTDEEIIKLANTIKCLQFNVNGYYDNNQIFAGGVSLNVLSQNLEHKQIKNLYFTGEACNVDGVCGGYNLQWAWTSGYIVGASL